MNVSVWVAWALEWAAITYNLPTAGGPFRTTYLAGKGVPYNIPTALELHLADIGVLLVSSVNVDSSRYIAGKHRFA